MNFNRRGICVDIFMAKPVELFMYRVDTGGLIDTGKTLPGVLTRSLQRQPRWLNKRDRGYRRFGQTTLLTIHLPATLQARY